MLCTSLRPTQWATFVTIICCPDRSPYAGKSFTVQISMALSVKDLLPSGFAMLIAGTPCHNLSKSRTIGARKTSMFSAVGDFGPGISRAMDMKNFFVNSQGGRL